MNYISKIISILTILLIYLGIESLIHHILYGSLDGSLTIRCYNNPITIALCVITTLIISYVTNNVKNADTFWKKYIEGEHIFRWYVWIFIIYVLVS